MLHMKISLVALSLIIINALRLAHQEAFCFLPIKSALGQVIKFI